MRIPPPPLFNGLLKCPLLRRVSYFICLLGWFSHISSSYWRQHIFWNRWYFFHGNWNGYVSIPCSVWRHWTCVCCSLWLSMNWMSAPQLFTTGQKLYPLNTSVYWPSACRQWDTNCCGHSISFSVCVTGKHCHSARLTCNNFSVFAVY